MSIRRKSMRSWARSIADEFCRWLDTSKPAARSYEELVSLMQEAAVQAYESQGISHLLDKFDLNSKLDMSKPVSFAVSALAFPQNR